MKTLKFLSRIVLIYFIAGQVTVVTSRFSDDRFITTANGTRYFVEIRYQYTWYEAFLQCTLQNLRLVVIDSEAKNTDLVNRLKVKYGFSRDLWIGAHDQMNTAIDTKRPFYWIPTGEQMTYSNWGGKNPTNTGGIEHCVQTWQDADNFQWNDKECSYNKAGYICEDRHIPCDEDEL